MVRRQVGGGDDKDGRDGADMATSRSCLGRRTLEEEADSDRQEDGVVAGRVFWLRDKPRASCFEGLQGWVGWEVEFEIALSPVGFFF